jgi:hypothetical protein
MTEDLYKLLEKLPRQKLIHLMWESLDYMQQWNGRSRQECILLALGATPVEKDGRTVYKIEKSLSQIKKDLETMGL